jgi:general secretion pathway protein F
MPVYAYRALTPAGRACAGVVDADSEQAAWQTLRTRGMYPTTLREDRDTPASASAGGRRVAAAELAAVTRQMAVLVRAGVPVAEALEAAAEATEAPRLLGALTRVRAAVREGRPLADALGDAPGVFPPLYRELVRAAEAAGSLGTVLAHLATHLERAAALRGRLRATLAYPAVMAVAVLAVLAFLLTWVLPQMAQLFEQTGVPLPVAARVLLAAGTVAAASWWVWLLALGAGFLGVRAWSATPGGRARIDSWLLGLPGIGRVVGATALARVAHALSTVLAGGVRLEVALDLAGAAAGNVRIASAFAAAREAVRQGQQLAPALRASGVVPPSLLRLVATGERSGGLADALAHAADHLDAQVERDVAAATAFAEPVLVLVMGAVVLLLVLTVLVPLVQFDPLAAS